MRRLSLAVGRWAAPFAAAALVAAGCERGAADPLAPATVLADATPAALLADATAAPAPSPLVAVTSGARSLEFWPFAGASVASDPQDPINLIFAGNADPRALRATLLMLDGDRTAFGLPDVFPFNCTWSDAIGGVETAYATGPGWLGSAVQLQCGTFGPVRIHLRLFGAGEGWTIANAHFELLIPGTTDHQVLSWELAEQLVTVDFLRSGLLDPAAPLFPTAQINPSPFRTIPAVIYNGLPVELRAAIGGPLGDVAADVPIGTDGHATVFNVTGSVSGQPVVATQDFVVQFDQVIPKPFCASGPADYLYVTGPVQLRQRVTVTPAGNYLSEFHAVGHLDITPVNPLTSPPTPVGDPYRAIVQEHDKGIVTDNLTLASIFQLQILIPPGQAGHGRLDIRVVVGPAGRTQSELTLRCAS